jgi:serine/threonine-protein kinase HipA
VLVLGQHVGVRSARSHETFNWLIGGTDAHAKNYSLLISEGNEVRLSPLYDLSSQLPYPELIEQRVAMKIGDHYDIPLIGFTEWQALASACAVNPEILMNRLRHLADKLPEAISAARGRALTNGLNHRVITTLVSVNGRSGRMRNDRPAPSNSNPIDP